MEWLLDMVDLSDFAQQNKVTSNLTVKYGNAVVGIKAKQDIYDVIFMNGNGNERNKNETCVIS